MFRKTNKNCNSYEFTFDFNKKNEHKIKRLNKLLFHANESTLVIKADRLTVCGVL